MDSGGTAVSPPRISVTRSPTERRATGGGTGDAEAASTLSSVTAALGMRVSGLSGSRVVRPRSGMRPSLSV
ncbi:hypothetical protein GCM10010372_69580 [Streptomyces tauricus]|nr:hypothetical protein GCM10010372_69580 [Streptomyces tauricus]